MGGESAEPTNESAEPSSRHLVSCSKKVSYMIYRVRDVLYAQIRQKYFSVIKLDISEK